MCTYYKHIDRNCQPETLIIWLNCYASEMARTPSINNAAMFQELHDLIETKRIARADAVALVAEKFDRKNVRSVNAQYSRWKRDHHLPRSKPGRNRPTPKPSELGALQASTMDAFRSTLSLIEAKGRQVETLEKERIELVTQLEKIRAAATAMGIDLPQ